MRRIQALVLPGEQVRIAPVDIYRVFRSCCIVCGCRQAAQG